MIEEDEEEEEKDDESATESSRTTADELRELLDEVATGMPEPSMVVS